MRIIIVFTLFSIALFAMGNVDFYKDLSEDMKFIISVVVLGGLSYLFRDKKTESIYGKEKSYNRRQNY